MSNAATITFTMKPGKWQSLLSSGRFMTTGVNNADNFTVTAAVASGTTTVAVSADQTTITVNGPLDTLTIAVVSGDPTPTIAPVSVIFKRQDSGVDFWGNTEFGGNRTAKKLGSSRIPVIVLQDSSPASGSTTFEFYILVQKMDTKTPDYGLIDPKIVSTN
jgi:hypothetical protein